MRTWKLLASASVASIALQGDGVIRLKPAEFRQLPGAVRRDLDRRGCTIPQYPGKTAPHNVLTGSFVAKGSRDWAVLCSIRGKSRILVYRGGSSRRVDSLGAAPDTRFVRRASSGVMEFSRKMEVADPRNVLDMAKADDDQKSFTVDHDGIDDGFVEKGSTIWYYRRGKWMELQPADEVKP